MKEHFIKGNWAKNMEFSIQDILIIIGKKKTFRIPYIFPIPYAALSSTPNTTKTQLDFSRLADHQLH